MNYLGHLYFSKDDKILMLNNLYGDFVKGKDLSYLPENVLQGVLLHREIDNFIDTFPAVRALQKKLHAELPKISAVAIDLYFDHLLAKNWKKFHTQDLNFFIDGFYRSIDLNLFAYSDEFKIMISKMIEINWLTHYASIDGLDKMCKGVSSKISFDNALKNGKKIFLNHEEEITTVFNLYMKDAIKKFSLAN